MICLVWLGLVCFLGKYRVPPAFFAFSIACKQKSDVTFFYIACCRISLSNSRNGAKSIVNWYICEPRVNFSTSIFVLYFLLVLKIFFPVIFRKRILLKFKGLVTQSPISLSLVKLIPWYPFPDFVFILFFICRTQIWARSWRHKAHWFVELLFFFLI